MIEALWLQGKDRQQRMLLLAEASVDHLSKAACSPATEQGGAGCSRPPRVCAGAACVLLVFIRSALHTHCMTYKYGVQRKTMICVSRAQS